MDTLAICLSGFLFLVLFAFLLSFYREIARAYRFKKAKRKRLGLHAEEHNDPYKSGLKIPGYYEELTKRSRQEEQYRSRPTII